MLANAEEHYETMTAALQRVGGLRRPTSFSRREGPGVGRTLSVSTASERVHACRLHVHVLDRDDVTGDMEAREDPHGQVGFPGETEQEWNMGNSCSDDQGKPG